MTLVEMETEMKFLEVKTLIKNEYKQQQMLYYWIGGIMSQQPKNHFVWISSGKEFTYSNWYGNNPDFHQGNEYCAEMQMHRDLQWNDNLCGNKQCFICEYSKKQLEYQSKVQHLESLRNKLQQELEEKTLQIQQNQEIQNNLKEKLAKEIEKNNKLEIEKNLKLELSQKNIDLQEQNNKLQKYNFSLQEQIEQLKDHKKILGQEELTKVEEEPKILKNFLNILQNHTKNANSDFNDANNKSNSKNMDIRNNVFFNTIITNSL